MRQTGAFKLLAPFLNASLEAAQMLRVNTCADIIDTRGKRYANCFTKAALDRLRPSLYCKKSLLLVSITVIGAIPIAIVGEPPATSACDTPVGDLMERTAEVVRTEVDSMRRPRLIVRLGGIADECRLIADGKHAVKQARQLVRINWFNGRHLRSPLALSLADAI